MTAARPTCATPGCNNPVAARHGTTGRPPIYCSRACRLLRTRRTQPVDIAVATNKHITVHLNQDEDAPDHPGRSWIVTLRRGRHNVIIGHDLGRFAAATLTHDLRQLLNLPATHKGAAID